MPKYVCNAAQLRCSCGMAPSTLIVIDPTRATDSNMPIAIVNDFVPMVNIMPFGMCQSQANPQVAAATAAACGALTPMPCMPVITTPWSPGSKFASHAGQAFLLDSDKCRCAWNGEITIQNPNSKTSVEE